MTTIHDTTFSGTPPAPVSAIDRLPHGELDSRSSVAPPRSVLAGSREGLTALPELLATATDAALEILRTGPLPAGQTADVLRAAAIALGDVAMPHEGIGVEAALRRVAHVITGQGIDLASPRAAAHLQPPPLAVAVAADALASVTNASLDTYDSGASAIAIERWVIGALVELAELDIRADGVLTPGGSISNLLGILLARDAAALRLGVDATRDGVHALGRPVVFCSELAHFSIHRACAALGLGENAVQPVPADGCRRMRTSVLARMLGERGASHTPVAIVATAGTTDFGSIDPLLEIAELAKEYGVWMHVDAAYGFGALFSTQLAHRLAGIEHADSITLDLHKLGWQPAAASVLLVSDPAAFASFDREVAYLNPKDDTEQGLDGLLGRSLQTTRRPDAVKIAATLLAYGRRGLGELVDRCHALARYAERRISSEPRLELVAPAELTTVVFRYRCRRRVDGSRFEDELNGALRRQLLETGTALIGRTEVVRPGESSACVCLKLTLLNPTATARDIDDIVDAVLGAGRALESVYEEKVA